MSTGMDLSVLVESLGVNAPAIPINGLTVDNRKVQTGMVFVALQGTQRHGIEFVLAAEAAGAVAILCQTVPDLLVPPLRIPVIMIENLGQKLGYLVARFYGHPTRQLYVVGVTGTDGKTSVTHFIAEALNALQQRSAVLGTLGSGLPGQLQTATHTTPDAVSVQARLADLLVDGFQNVAMEVSSHALDQGRVHGVEFDVAVLTNLSRDHLDYHGSIAAYAEAKRKLFQWPNLKNIVVNLDDAFGEDIAEQAEADGLNVLCYGIGEVDEFSPNTVIATQATFDHDGIHAHLVTPYGEGDLYAPVLGHFNLHNLLAALGVLLVKGIPLADALNALRSVSVVPGRMERVEDAGTGILTVVDYAHTAGALGQVLQAVRHHTPKRLLCVFGCGGDRDRGKRPLMASAAEQYADLVIVTDDNPRTESSAQIFEDIAAGFAESDAVIFEHDRDKAIHLAINAAAVGDAVLIAGKGHETVQILKRGSVPFDDRQVASLALQERSK